MRSLGPWDPGPSMRGMPPQLPLKLTLLLSFSSLGAVLLVAIVIGGFYVMQPTEMAGVRRLGTVVTDQPVGPGLHVRLPLVDTVDTIQTSLDTFQLANLPVSTLGTSAVNISLRVPASAVL